MDGPPLPIIIVIFFVVTVFFIIFIVVIIRLITNCVTGEDRRVYRREVIRERPVTMIMPPAANFDPISTIPPPNYGFRIPVSDCKPSPYGIFPERY